MVTRRDIVATVNLGKLAELRARLAQLKAAAYQRSLKVWTVG